MEHKPISYDALVIGAGIAGITAALELAETGFTVALVEKEPFIGGRVSRINLYFPKMCPPTCGLEINMKRIKDNDKIKLFTLSEVTEIKGKAGDFNAKVKVKPRYIKENADDKQCERAAAAMAQERPNGYNLGLDNTKLVYLPYNNAFPLQYVFDKDACSDEEAKMLASNFSDVIDLDQKEETVDINVKTVIWATGWDPYDATKLETLGFGKYPGVIRNVEMERLASPSGPYNGKIKIPGSDKEIKSVAFCQCAGSRDELHMEFCSSICCLASMKQAQYIREQYPDADIHIFYIDVRTHGIFEEFYWKTQKDEKIFWHRGKVAKVIQELGKDTYIVEAEDTISGKLRQAEVDMVVLATGMKPTTSYIEQVDKQVLDRNGFIMEMPQTGIHGCGVCTGPKDVAAAVRDATGAAIKAIHTIKENK
jgi:quinone-modifying oxidoreductase, subunit QmoA